MKAFWHFVYSYLFRLDKALAVQEVQSLCLNVYEQMLKIFIITEILNM